jgi:hypothetical protein
MTATGQNFTMYQGDDRVLAVTVLDDSDNVVNITNTDIAWVMYKQTDETVVLQKTTSSGIQLTTPVSGIFEISLNPVDTENLKGHYLHEAELRDVEGRITTIMTGHVEIYRSLASNP